MKRLHQTVIAASTASLVVLGLAGTRAQADNIAPIKSSHHIANPVRTQTNDLDQVRRKVQVREENDGGCG